MRLHARNIAFQAGALKKNIDVVAEQMIKERKIRVDRAKEILAELSESKINRHLLFVLLVLHIVNVRSLSCPPLLGVEQ